MNKDKIKEKMSEKEKAFTAIQGRIAQLYTEGCKLQGEHRLLEEMLKNLEAEEKKPVEGESK